VAGDFKLHYSLFTIHYSLFTIHYSLFTIHYSLFTISIMEPLKNLYNKTLIENLGNRISERYSDFNKKAFRQAVFDKNWQDKELKQRMRHIAVCLHRQLPENYIKAIRILKPVSSQFSGFEYMFFQDYVECYGLHDFETSIDALAHFTKHASSEFAVRAFILQDEKRMMQQMAQWAKSDNHHIRRLASEGCRPRLPWAISLPAFKKNPKPVLSILKTLMNDDSEYVRRSVANNLNDIAKDHPERIIDWAQRWLGKNRNTDRLVKHACRTLLKQGNPQVMDLFGFATPSHLKVSRLKVQPEVNPGETLDFSFLLKTQKEKLGKCRLEFAINFVKANDSLSRKVFKIAESDYAEKEKLVTKYFSFKKISTRKYYAGTHNLTIIVNGVEQASKTFRLLS